MRARRRDPAEAAQVRAERRRAMATRLGRWHTGEAAQQVLDLALLARHQLPTRQGAEADATELSELVELLYGRAAAYDRLTEAARRTEQETP